MQLPRVFSPETKKPQLIWYRYPRIEKTCPLVPQYQGNHEPHSFLPPGIYFYAI